MSAAAEACGADFLCGIPGIGLVSFQRKTIRDLYASMHDGRMTRELSLMREKTQLPYLVVEGHVRWMPSGELVPESGPPMRMTRQQFRSYMCSVQATGVSVMFTEDPGDTAQAIETVIRWAMKPEHKSLVSVPNMRGAFDLPATPVERGMHLLQALCPGIGPVLSRRVVEHFGGRVPVSWELAGPGDFTDVEGIGPKRAAELWAAAAPRAKQVSA
jgi:ERCC4-type nuclease